MNPKTPKFNEAMEKYFSELKLDEQGGQERVCRISGEKFYVRPEDIEFYKKIQVPLPTLSPDERMRRREATINISKLFYGKSFQTKKKIISAYPKDTPYKILEKTIWSNEDFSSLGLKEIDLQNSFFAQYKKLQLIIPRPNLFVEKSINSDYANFASNLKDCYLVFDAVEAENCFYCEYLDHSKNCYYCNGVINSENCYDSLRSDRMYNCYFVEYSENCLNSYFLADCKNCSDCFMCTNLRHKKYCFKNKQLTPEEYQKKIKGIDFGDYDVVMRCKEEFQELKKKSVARANRSTKNVNSIGLNLKNTKNCFQVLVSENSENLAYSMGVSGSRDVFDSFISWPGAELSYEIAYSFGAIYNTKFSIMVSDAKNCEYCDHCRNCSDCFGCIGLKNKRYHIFNKSYSEEEYWQKVDELKTEMLKRGEYGEFFPPELAPFPYNASEATAYDGYHDIITAKKYGYNTQKIQEIVPPKDDDEMNIEDVPKNIKDIDDGILSKVIVDKKIIKSLNTSKKN